MAIWYRGHNDEFEITNDVGHTEDNSLKITDKVTGKYFIIADTGNGGSTAYQLLDPINEAEDHYGEFGYFARDEEATYAAMYWFMVRRVTGALNALGGVH